MEEKNTVKNKIVAFLYRVKNQILSENMRLQTEKGDDGVYKGMEDLDRTAFDNVDDSPYQSIVEEESLKYSKSSQDAFISTELNKTKAAIKLFQMMFEHSEKTTKREKQIDKSIHATRMDVIQTILSKHKKNILVKKDIEVDPAIYINHSHEKFGEFHPEKINQWPELGKIKSNLYIFPFDDNSVILIMEITDQTIYSFMMNDMMNILPKAKEFLDLSKQAVLEKIRGVEEISKETANQEKKELEKVDSMNRSSFSTIYDSFQTNKFLMVVELQKLLDYCPELNIEEVKSHF